jgi:DNA-binding NarL/FixJ family response regulator
MQNHGVPTVFLVDDSAPIRERLKELLVQGSPVRIVGEADRAASAIEGILATRPTVAVLDYRLPDGTAVDILRAVAGVARETVFIVLTNHVTAAVLAACLAAGAQHFLDKSTEFDRLNEIIADFDAHHA